MVSFQSSILWIYVLGTCSFVKADGMCGWEWRHMITMAMNITKRLIIHEAESTHKYHHKHPLEIRSTRKKNWNKRLTKHLGNLKKTLVKLQVISRWPRARQCRGPVRMLLINKGVSPLVRIPAVTECFLCYITLLFTCQSNLFLATSNVIQICNIHTTVPLINLVCLVITGKSQTVALMYWPSDQGPGLRFPCHDLTDKVNKLFIMWLFHYGPEPAINNWSQAQQLVSRLLEKTCHLNELYTWLAIQSGDIGQRIPFLTVFNWP